MPFVRTPQGEVIEVGNDALFTDQTAQTPLAIPTGQVFTAEDIARARQEEKDKLYSKIDGLSETINGLNEQVGGLTAEQQRQKAQAEEERERLAAEARRKEEENLDAPALVEKARSEWEQQLNQVNQTWEQKFEQAEQQRLAAEEIARKEREFTDLRDYAQSLVESNKDKIAPQFLPWIKGNTKEEIDAVVNQAIASTNQIADEMQQALGQQQSGVQTWEQKFEQPGVPQPPATPGTRPSAGPTDMDPAGQFQQQLTAEQIAQMPMDKYAELRRTMGIGGQSNNRGLFG